MTMKPTTTFLIALSLAAALGAQAADEAKPAPKAQGKAVKPAYYTVIHNGALVHNHVEVPGNAVECPISLQDHLNPVRYRNIWLRPLKGHDE